jgi:transposase
VRRQEEPEPCAEAEFRGSGLVTRCADRRQASGGEAGQWRAGGGQTRLVSSPVPAATRRARRCGAEQVAAQVQRGLGATVPPAHGEVIEAHADEVPNGALKHVRAHVDPAPILETPQKARTRRRECPMVKRKKRRERRRFTAEFKAEAVRLVEVGGKSIPQVARELDLTESALRNWVEQARSEKQGGLTADERQELICLRKENKRLEMEREILNLRRPSSRRKAPEIRVHPRGEGQLPDQGHVQSPGGISPGVLRVVPTRTVATQAGRR